MNIPGFGNVDFSALQKGRESWETFKRNHPKFPEFLKYIGNKGLTEGTNIEITVTYPNGQNVKTNVKMKPEDVEIFNSTKGLWKNFL